MWRTTSLLRLGLATTDTKAIIDVYTCDVGVVNQWFAKRKVGQPYVGADEPERDPSRVGCESDTLLLTVLGDRGDREAKQCQAGEQASNHEGKNDGTP